MEIVEIDGREFADLGAGVTAEVMDIEVEMISEVELAALFGPAPRDIGSMLRDGDGRRSRRHRPGRTNDRRRAIRESIGR